MKISKSTVSELLDEYLINKGIVSETREKIKDSLFDNVDKKISQIKEKEKLDEKKEKEREKRDRKKVKVSHGTSCVRISDGEDLLLEF